MNHYTLVRDFVVLLLAAGLAGMLCKRLGLSAIVGYLLAGIVIGPYSPPFSLIMDTELQTLVVSGIVFLLALVAIKAGYSIALGAFLFGALIAEMPQKRAIEESFGSLRNLFGSIFFVSIGMMIDLSLLRAGCITSRAAMPRPWPGNSSAVAWCRWRWKCCSSPGC